MSAAVATPLTCVVVPEEEIPVSLRPYRPTLDRLVRYVELPHLYQWQTLRGSRWVPLGSPIQVRRAPTEARCFVCGQPGHSLLDCPTSRSK